MELTTFEHTRSIDQTTAGLQSIVGNTPLLPIRFVTAHLPENIRVYAKAEWFNPAGSVKARPALNIMQTALSNGSLKQSMRLLDSTSGNMGIAYATLGPSLGVQTTLVLPENASPERIKIIRALGADLVLTDALEGSDGAVEQARKMSLDRPDLYFYANQYDNPANWQAHFYSTAPEIIQQTSGKITHFVAGMGTSGTLMGAAKYYLQTSREVSIIGVQPDSPLHGLEGLKHYPSAIRPQIYDHHYVDDLVQVSTEDAHEMVRRLARKEGLFVGVSSGANICAALRLASSISQGTIVTVLPDAGYKYLSDDSLWIG